MELELKAAEERESVSGEIKPIVCNQCNLKLGQILISQVPHQFPERLNIELPVRYQFNCECGGKTFVIRSRNKSYIVIEDDFEMKGFAQNGNLYSAKIGKKCK